MSYNDFARPAQEASWGFAFAQRLRQLIERRGIKVTELSRRTGIPKSTIDSYTEGVSIPNYFRMDLLAKELGMSVCQLADLRPNADILYYDDEDDEE